MSKAIDNFHKLSSKQRRYFFENKSLLIDLIKTNLSEHRFLHTLGCAKMAKDLASYHHIDKDKAYLAGLFHDITKELDEEQQDQYLRYYDPDKLNVNYKIKHSYTAKYYLREKFNLHDSDILNAVYNHTVLESNDKLSMILYVADKREENRHIDDEVYEVAKYDLKKAISLLRKRFEEEKERKNNGTIG